MSKSASSKTKTIDGNMSVPI